MLPALESEDAVTAMPLNPGKYVSVRSPDGGLTLYYNTCTLIKIGLEKGGCLMQPPHFREVMDVALRKQVEEVEGVTKIRFDKPSDEAVLVDAHGATLYSDMVDYSAGDGEMDYLLNTTFGNQIAHRAQQQVSRFEHHVNASQYHVSRTEVYVCPICFEHMLRRCVARRQRNSEPQTEIPQNGHAFLEAYTSSYDPLDVLATAHPTLQLPLIAFRYIKDWKAHMLNVHGNVVEHDGANDHRMRDYIWRFQSRKNVQFFNKKQFDKGFDTTKWYWDHNGRFNVTRYNRLVAVAEVMVKGEGARYVGWGGPTEITEDANVLVVSPDYDGFGKGQQVVSAKDIRDGTTPQDEDTSTSNLLPSHLRYNDNCKSGIRSINLNHPMPFITRDELTTTAPFADLPWSEVKEGGAQDNDEAFIVDDDDIEEMGSASSSSSSSGSSARAHPKPPRLPHTAFDDVFDEEDEAYLEMCAEAERERKARSKAKKRKQEAAKKPTILLEDDSQSLLLLKPDEPSSISSSSSSSSSSSDSSSNSSSSSSDSSSDSVASLLEVEARPANPLDHLMQSAKNKASTPKRSVFDRLGACAGLTPKERDFIGLAEEREESTKQRDLKRSGVMSRSTIRQIPQRSIRERNAENRYGIKRSRSNSSTSSSGSSSSSSTDDIDRQLKEYDDC